MYFALIVLTMLVFPAISSFLQLLLSSTGASLFGSLSSWFVFWALGVRLLLAGLRQVFQPAFTAEHIFEISDTKSHVIVQELGFANLSFGVVGIVSLWIHAWAAPAALLGCLFYGLAGFNHILKKKNQTEWIAMISDLYASVLMLSIFVLRP